MRAVVVGCGLAGIAAAAAVRDACDEVVLVERDLLPAGPVARRGVPQAAQLHNLLGCAQRHLDSLLPGFCDVLLDAGAGQARVADETHVYELGVRMPERDLGMRLMCAPRPLIEHVARTLLLAGGGVELRDGTSATGLLIGAGGAVAGVEVERDGVAERIEAPLVVDAGGARSSGPDWLRAAGTAAPETRASRTDQWYVSALFERTADWVGRNFAWLIFPTPPRTRAGLVSPVGDDRWYASVSGRAGDRPPSSVDELRAYAATLEDTAIADVLGRARPVADPTLFRKTDAHWRRYDLLEDPLPGFVPLGDAVASLNPLFGQGMSVAAWQAAVLRSTLTGANMPNDLDAATRLYHARAAEASGAAWDLGEIIQPDQARSRESLAAFARAVQDDPELHRVYVAVWHLLEPAPKLDQFQL